MKFFLILSYLLYLYCVVEIEEMKTTANNHEVDNAKTSNADDPIACTCFVYKRYTCDAALIDYLIVELQMLKKTLDDLDDLKTTIKGICTSDKFDARLIPVSSVPHDSLTSSTAPSWIDDIAVCVRTFFKNGKDPFRKDSYNDLQDALPTDREEVEEG